MNLPRVKEWKSERMEISYTMDPTRIGVIVFVGTKQENMEFKGI